MRRGYTLTTTTALKDIHITYIHNNNNTCQPKCEGMKACTIRVRMIHPSDKVLYAFWRLKKSPNIKYMFAKGLCLFIVCMHA